jgi:hypothetical protein
LIQIKKRKYVINYQIKGSKRRQGEEWFTWKPKFPHQWLPDSLPS